MAENQLAKVQFDLSPRNFDEAIAFSERLARSNFVPQEFKGKPEDCLVAMQFGYELGLKPLQALCNIAVIRGRPTVWGDAVPALVMAHPLFESLDETDDGHTATCKIKRRGNPAQVRTFSMDDAKLAGLAGKTGPWTQYPKRMRQMRARSFAVRDVFPDALRGVQIAEEMLDMGFAEQVQTERIEPPAAAPQKEIYPAEKFAANLADWRKIVEGGKKSPESLLAFLNAKNAATPFDAEQTAAILALKPRAPADVTDVVAKSAAPAPVAAPVAAPIAAPAQAVTYMQVVVMLERAKTEDELNRAAGKIDLLADPGEQSSLNAIYESCIEQLRNQQEPPF